MKSSLIRSGFVGSGRTGKDCYDAILATDADALGKSMNECMECWEAMLPNTVGTKRSKST